MTTAEPARPASTPASGSTVTSRVRASVLASWQLVEDARYRPAARSSTRQRVQAQTERAVAARMVAREFERGEDPTWLDQAS